MAQNNSDTKGIGIGLGAGLSDFSCEKDTGSDRYNGAGGVSWFSRESTSDFGGGNTMDFVDCSGRQRDDLYNYGRFYSFDLEEYE